MPTVEELNALPYGPAEAPAQLLSVDELNALPYSVNPFGQGILVSDYQKVYEEHGRPFRWRRAVLTPNGAEYVEVTQALDGRPLSQARCLVWSTTRSVQTQQFGWVSTAVTMFSCLPHQAEMAPGDQVCLFDVPTLHRERVTRQAGSNPLSQHPVFSIERVFREDGSEVPATAYAPTPEGIAWRVGAPQTGASLSVDYRTHGWYEWQPDDQGLMQVGADGKRLPQRGRLERIASL